MDLAVLPVLGGSETVAAGLARLRQEQCRGLVTEWQTGELWVSDVADLLGVHRASRDVVRLRTLPAVRRVAELPGVRALLASVIAGPAGTSYLQEEKAGRRVGPPVEVWAHQPAVELEMDRAYADLAVVLRTGSHAVLVSRHESGKPGSGPPVCECDCPDTARSEVPPVHRGGQCVVCGGKYVCYP
jgi:hypothetical protein